MSIKDPPEPILGTTLGGAPRLTPTICETKTQSAPILNKPSSNDNIPKSKTLPIKKSNKDSLIAIQIRKAQEERKKREMELNKINEETEIKEPKKIKKEPIPIPKLQKENNKELNEQKEREQKRQDTIKKYGYDPFNKLIKPIPINNKEQHIELFSDTQEINNEHNSNLRSPLIGLFGYTKSGKTCLVESIKESKNGDNEQIGSTFISINDILKKTEQVNSKFKTKLTYSIPGVIFIDIPGHEIFENLRLRTQELCDMVILVINIITDLDKQTIHIIQSLTQNNKPFIIALNKVDMIYSWKPIQSNSIIDSLKSQEKNVQMEFKERVKSIKTQIQELGLNTELYYNNKDYNNTISIVPISAITKEGIPDLLMYISQLSQKLIHDKLIKSTDIDCTVLEVKNVPHKGLSIDVTLKNGTLTKGDKIMLCGIKCIPIITHIKSILTEKNILHDTISASTVCTIMAASKAIPFKDGVPNLEDVVAGSPLFVINPDDSDELINEHKMNVVKPFLNLKKNINTTNEGISINTSSLSNMEALLHYFENKIPISNVKIGPVRKKDITKASMQTNDDKILIAYDVEIDPEIIEYTNISKVKIFKHNNIYELFNMIDTYIFDKQNVNKKSIDEKVIYPCILKILPEYVFNKKSPIVIGVEVKEGVLKKGTPICIPSKENIEIGTIVSIEKNNKQIDQALINEEVCVNITQTEDKQQYAYDRHFKSDDLLCSKITRESINAIVSMNPEFVSQKDIFRLIKKLKRDLNII